MQRKNNETTRNHNKKSVGGMLRRFATPSQTRRPLGDIRFHQYRDGREQT